MRFSFSVFCCCAVLSLGACAAQHPYSMPRGYSSYDQTYKSAPGPKVKNIGYEYSYKENETVLKDIRYVARDLVEKLNDKLAMNVDEVYLKMQSDSAFYNSFDHAIREELTNRGYLLSNSPVNTLTLDFIVVDKLPKCTGVVQGEGVYRTLFLGLAVNVAKGAPQDMVGGYYEVPTYDLKKGNKAGIRLELCPEEQQVVDITRAMKEHEEEQSEFDDIVKEPQAEEDVQVEEVQQRQEDDISASEIIPELLGKEQTKASEEVPGE